MVMQKFIFDGPNKLFIEKPENIDSSGISNIDIQVDLYSDWKEHINNATGTDIKFLQALRTVGGDPLTAGRTLGDTYFLMNGYRIRPAETGHKMVLTGNLFTEEGDSAVVSTTGAHNILAESFVSNLIDASATVADFDVAKMQHLIESQRSDHAAFGNVYYWDAIQGNDAQNALTPEKARKTFKSIHDNLVTDGNHDVVFIISSEPTGVVNIDEQIKITKRAVHVRGPGFHARIKPTTLPPVGEAAVEIQGDLCEVDSFRVFCDAVDVPAIQATGVGSIKISNIFVEQCGGDAIAFSGDLHNQAIHNNIRSCLGDGIVFTDCAFGTIEGNTISNVSGWGISVKAGNLLKDNRGNLIGDDNVIHHTGPAGAPRISGILIGSNVQQTVIRKDNFLIAPATGSITDLGIATHNEVLDSTTEVSQSFSDATTSEGITFDNVMTALNAMARGRIVESSTNIFDFYDNAGTGVLFRLTKTATERVPSGVSI